MTRFAGYSAIVPDVRQTIDFYVQAFDMKLRYLHPTGQYAELETGEALLSFTGELLWEDAMAGSLPYLRTRPTNHPGTGYIALVVEDIDAALNRAIAAGAVKLTEPQLKPWGQVIALLRDNNGHLVELATPAVR